MDLIDDVKKTIQEDIKKLQHELRVILPDMIKKAVELGDLTENADYQYALQRQEFVKIRLGNLSRRLSDISMINISTLPHDEIGLGSEITLLNLDTDEEKTFRLVMSEQTDPAKGYISVQSPVGQAFLGKEEGDEVEVKTPQGIKNFEVLKLKTVHDFKKES
ncbi:GreA/GreB family elongation factor [candidate division CSSED10-310 bacterium]|uniref:GreA/GreB family elongation factor n=1 Tax=candidate division CSSED10-310 bacterium TaxID=2855610 RepID=A0ABV6YVN8_UNCC1